MRKIGLMGLIGLMAVAGFGQEQNIQRGGSGGGGGAVNSVNGQSGTVTLAASDVGAAATSHTHVESDVTSLVSDLAGKAGTNDTRALTFNNAASAITVGTVTATTFVGNSAILSGGTNGFGDIYLNGAVYYRTSSIEPLALDGSLPLQWCNTNADFAIAFVLPLDSPGYEGLLTVSNSKASNITITGPVNARYLGTASTNSMVLGSGKQGIWEWMIKKGKVTNIVNIAEQ